MLRVPTCHPRPRCFTVHHPKGSSRCPFHHVTSSRSLGGFLGASTSLFVQATACALRRISTPSPYTVASVLPSVCVKTLGIRNCVGRSCTSTSGSATSPTAYRMLWVRLPHVLVHRYRFHSGSNTRYGWGANPCPTGTCTLQDTPGFDQRDNGCAQPPLETTDVLRKQRRLAVQAIGWSALLDESCSGLENREPNVVRGKRHSLLERFAEPIRIMRHVK